MSVPGSVAWFAQHETRLAWRDMFSVVRADQPGRLRGVVIAVSVFLTVMHVIAHFVVGPLANRALQADLAALVGVSVGIVLAGSAILSQAMENVTRTFYTRSDLELILASPAKAQRLFVVRIAGIVASVSLMSVVFVGPFINVLAFHGGVQWLAAYGVIPAIALFATTMAIMMTVGLFRLIGPVRTRLIAQIAAAIVGAFFAIGLQLAALFSTGTMSRLSFLASEDVLARVPDPQSLVWLPARAVLGDGLSLLLVLGGCLVAFLVVAGRVVPRFPDLVMAASSTPRGAVTPDVADRAFRVESPIGALRRKEIMLILRDPWLLSQSLMQLLYLVPPAALLWQSYAMAGGAPMVIVPVLVMAAGQLAGALAWLTICGEDAPDLVSTAPVSPAGLLRSKLEAVMLCIGAVFLPFLIGLMFLSLEAALVASVAIAVSAASATAIQYWFRAQARRSLFRRRHASSRIATFAEAFSSILWAAAAALAIGGNDLWIVVTGLVLLLLAGVRRFSPGRSAP